MWNETVVINCHCMKKSSCFWLYPSWKGTSITDYWQLVCCCCPSPFWGYIILFTALDGIRSKRLLLSAVYTLQAAWLWGLACRGERRWCLVKLFFVSKMFCLSAVLLLTANAEISCTPRILRAKYPTTNVRARCIFVGHSEQSIATWASSFAWQMDDKPTNKCSGSVIDICLFSVLTHVVSCNQNYLYYTICRKDRLKLTSQNFLKRSWKKWIDWALQN